MEWHPPTLPPLPAKLTPPPRPDFSTFSFSKIGRTPALLQRFGPRVASIIPAAGSDITVVQPNTSGLQHNATTEDEKTHHIQDRDPDISMGPIEQSNQSNNGNADDNTEHRAANTFDTDHDLSTFMELDLWSHAARVQEEWASIERPHVSPKLNIGSQMPTSQFPLSPPPLIAAPHNMSSDSTGLQLKPSRPTNANKYHQASSDGFVQQGHSEPKKTVNTAEEVTTIRTDDIDPKGVAAQILSVASVANSPVLASDPAPFSNPSSSTLVDVYSSASAVKDSSHGVTSHQAHPNGIGRPRIEALTPDATKPQSVASITTFQPVLDSERGSTSLLAENSPAQAGNRVATSVSLECRPQAQIQAVHGDGDDPDYRGKTSEINIAASSSHAAGNLEKRASAAALIPPENRSNDSFNSASLTKENDALSSNPAGRGVNKSSLKQQPTHAAYRVQPSQYNGPRVFSEEDESSARQVRAPSLGQKSSSRFERHENSRRARPYPQDLRGRTPPPRESLSRNDDYMASPTHLRRRSRSPSPASNRYRQLYNARSRSPRSPNNRPLPKRGPSWSPPHGSRALPPSHRCSPQSSGRFNGSPPVFLASGLERSQYGHHSPRQRQGSSILPHSQAGNGPYTAPNHRSQLSSSDFTSNVEANNTTHGIKRPVASVSSRLKPEPASTVTDQQASDRNGIASALLKRNRIEADISQPNTMEAPVEKRRKLEDGINEKIPQGPTLASRLFQSQSGSPLQASSTVMLSAPLRGPDLLDRLSNNSTPVHSSTGWHPTNKTLRTHKGIIPSRSTNEIGDLHSENWNHDHEGIPTLASRFNIPASSVPASQEVTNTRPQTSLVKRLEGAGTIDYLDSNDPTLQVQNQTQKESGGLLSRLQSTRFRDASVDHDYRDTKPSAGSLRERLG